MKKILFSVCTLVIFAMTSKVQAQCNIYNVAVNLQSANLVAGNCVIVADIAFDLQNNGGNKKVWINLWKTADFNALPFTAGHHSYLDGDMPTLNDLDGASNLNDPVAVIGFNNDVDPVVFFTTYSADPANITPKVGTSIVKTVGPVIDGNATSHIVITGVSFTSPGPCAGLVLQGDVWSSQAAGSSPTIHCYVAGISFYGDPTVNGQVLCTNPRMAQILLSSVSTASLSVKYTVYRDQGVIGVFDGDPIAIATSAPFNLSSGSPFNSGPLPYIGNNSLPASSSPLLVKLEVLSPFTKTIFGIITNSCIVLPVEFKSFTATRSSSNVTLRWETASEQNNSGFAVERNLNGAWEQVAFVPSQAQNGNSDITLVYAYVDQNNAKGVSQYRIRQVDINGKAKNSEIRSVRGIGQLGKTIVYPNPSSNGKINVVFEDSRVTREVSVSDMSGRIVRQVKGITNNNITLENLQPGMYLVKIVAVETGEQVVEKIVVNKQ